jgi:PEP-CTERM motif
MSASTSINKFSPLSFGLSLLSAIALSLPQSVQAISFAPTQEQSLNSEELTKIQAEELLRRRQEAERRLRQEKEDLTLPGWHILPCLNGAGFRCAPFIPGEPGSSQQNPIMPTVTRPNFWEFINVPRGRWNDPPTAYGFRYEMTSDSVFTEIIDFPTGFAKPFTVLVKDVILGEFTTGNSVNFTNYSALLGNLLVGGSGVKEFSVTGLNVDPTNPAAFPLQLDFNTETANFNMHALLNEAEAVPEPSTILGLVASGSFLVGVVRKRKQKLSR